MFWNHFWTAKLAVMGNHPRAGSGLKACCFLICWAILFTLNPFYATSALENHCVDFASNVPASLGGIKSHIKVNDPDSNVTNAHLRIFGDYFIPSSSFSLSLGSLPINVSVGDLIIREGGFLHGIGCSRNSYSSEVRTGINLEPRTVNLSVLENWCSRNQIAGWFNASENSKSETVLRHIAFTQTSQFSRRILLEPPNGIHESVLNSLPPSVNDSYSESRLGQYRVGWRLVSEPQFLAGVKSEVGGKTRSAQKADTCCGEYEVVAKCENLAVLIFMPSVSKGGTTIRREGNFILRSDEDNDSSGLDLGVCSLCKGAQAQDCPKTNTFHLRLRSNEMSASSYS